MDFDRQLFPFPAHPPGVVGRQVAATDASPEAAWNDVSARMIALAVLVLRHVNPHATARHLLSYVRHSTLRDLLDEATILDPELTARIMRDVRYDTVANAVENLL